ncbi:LuxR C-terminal-related transcriptional regulator [Daejeonella sp.]|uniref:LuxR C-terminal-related transcriptional regulator n=1 Tax=Daejeonella sp. TaxID=2805397 RepID=UPI0030BDAC69
MGRAKNIYLEAKKIWGTAIHAGPPGSKVLELQLEIHKRLLHIFQAGRYYYMVFNVYQMELEFISPDIESVLGFKPEEISAMFFLDRIHPDDKRYFLNSENKLTEFLKQLPLQKRGSYKIQHDYRIKAKDNTYVRLLHQILPIEYDENNYYRSLVLHTDITHIKCEGTPCFSIIGLDGEPSYYNIPENTECFTKSYDLFTRRERDVLKQIVEGRNSKEIADELCISLHTVNTHRKNILIKANCKSPVELVIKSIHEGWV